MNLERTPVVILAGGRGARFDHESQVLPKPLIEVAGKPIIRHIIDSLAAQGFRRFIVATGYLGEMFTAERLGMNSRLEELFICLGGFDEASVRIVDTGLDSHTGERVRRLADMGLVGPEPFVLTYGDGLADVDMRQVISEHEAWQAVPGLHTMLTVTAVHPPGRFGIIRMSPGTGNPRFSEVGSFDEKPSTDWINGGFMYVDPTFLSLLDGGAPLESVAIPAAARAGFVTSYKHQGYWRCMDTRRDLEQIEADVERAGHLPWMRYDTEEGTNAEEDQG